MTILTNTLFVDSDIDTVWGQLKDISLILKWHPDLKSVELSENDEVRKATFHDGNSTTERVLFVLDTAEKKEILFKEESYRFFESFYVTWTVVKITDKITKIVVVTDYKTIGLEGLLMTPWLWWLLPKQNKQILNSFKTYLEIITGL